MKETVGECVCSSVLVGKSILTWAIFRAGDDLLSILIFREVERTDLRRCHTGIEEVFGSVSALQQAQSLTYTAF